MQMPASTPDGKPEQVTLKIKRQEGPEESPYWEEFEVPYSHDHNIISALMEIRKNPVNAAGRETTPPSFLAACLEEVCGSCTMVINGKATQACTSLLDEYDLSEPITIEPMQKFPTERDLIVDRSQMFDDLKRARAWIDVDGSYDMGEGPKMSQDKQEFRYALARCMTCGVCLEVCPQYGDHTDFMGAFALSQIVLMNEHPTGEKNADERLDAALDPGGIQQCGNAQNCVRGCPKDIPLTTSLAKLQAQALGHSMKQTLSSGWEMIPEY